MALISLGWIFFRADSTVQARRMFAALLSPATYFQHSLHSSVYAIVLGIGVAYALTLWTLDWLDARARRPDAPAPSGRVHAIVILTRERWLWLAPMWAAATVLVLTMMTSQTRAANVFLYRSF
jgi:hypothetical protein